MALSGLFLISFLIVLNLITSPGYLWFIWPMMGWGIGVAAHAAGTFGIGKDGEERKIRELMDEERKSTKTL